MWYVLAVCVGTIVVALSGVAVGFGHTWPLVSLFLGSVVNGYAVLHLSAQGRLDNW